MRPSLAFGELLIAGWQTAGLLGPAVVKPLFSTVAKPLIRKSLGRLQASDRAVLDINVRNLLSAS